MSLRVISDSTITLVYYGITGLNQYPDQFSISASVPKWAMHKLRTNINSEVL